MSARRGLAISRLGHLKDLQSNERSWQSILKLAIMTSSGPFSCSEDKFFLIMALQSPMVFHVTSLRAERSDRNKLQYWCALILRKPRTRPHQPRHLDFFCAQYFPTLLHLIAVPLLKTPLGTSPDTTPPRASKAQTPTASNTSSPSHSYKARSTPSSSAHS